MFTEGKLLTDVVLLLYSTQDLTSSRVERSYVYVLID